MPAIARTLLLLFLLSCTAVGAQDTIVAKPPTLIYGTDFPPEPAWTTGGLAGLFHVKDHAYVTVEGTVVASGSLDGRWMELDLPQHAPILVQLQDDNVQGPVRDLSGRRVVVRGTAENRMVQEPTLRRRAQEAGRSAEEIARIIGPATRLTIIADGILLFD